MKKAVETPNKKDSTKETVLHLAFEPSESKWRMAFSDRDKMRYVTIDARNLEQLQEGICKAKRMKRAGKSMRNQRPSVCLSDTFRRY